MATISLSMIVKNEEKYLRGCLDSVKDVVDEIVIVDTGSTDRTLEIAEEYNAKIYHFEWINDFSAARNYALKHSTCDWILYLDADERLKEDSKRDLSSLINSLKYDAYNIIINNLDDYKNSPKLMRYVRLFRNSENIYFKGKAHEQILYSLKEQNYRIADAEFTIIHEGYNVTQDELKTKASRNLNLLLEDYNSNPSSYLAFQIANSYQILENLNESLRYYEIAVNDNQLRYEYKLICYIHLLDHFNSIGDLNTSSKIVELCNTKKNNNPLLLMVISQYYEKLGDLKSAIKFVRKAFDVNNKLIQKRSSTNSIEIIADNLKIILEGIKYSVKFNSTESCNFFLNKLKNENKELYEFLVSFFNDKIIINKKTKEALSLEYGKSLYNIVKLNSNHNLILDFYSNYFDLMNQNSTFLKEFGLFLMDINQTDQAEIIFEMGLKSDNIDESIIFYLASIYASKNESAKLKSLISLSENLLNTTDLFKSKLNVLKEKVAPLVQF